MQSASTHSTTIMPELKAPKSTRRFLLSLYTPSPTKEKLSSPNSANPLPFSPVSPLASLIAAVQEPPLDPLPSAGGAQRVRRPSDAMRSMRASRSLQQSLELDNAGRPMATRAATDGQGLIRTSPSSITRTTSTPTEINMPSPVSIIDQQPGPVVPFKATVLSVSGPQTAFACTSGIRFPLFVVLHFAYSSGERNDTSVVTLPWEILQWAGGHLIQLVQQTLREGEGGLSDEPGRPELTDGESGSESELEELPGRVDTYDLNELLLEQNRFRPRAATRNQYVQLFGRPESTNLRMSGLSATSDYAPPETSHSFNFDNTVVDQRVHKIEILLLRDAATYHVLSQRLLEGAWPTVGRMRHKVLKELEWLGMTELRAELQEMGSPVLRGGMGYI